MRAFTVQIDDDAAETYASEAKERGTSVEALMSSMLLDGADAFGDPLTPDQIAAVEAGLEDIRHGRTLSQEEASQEVRQRLGW